MADAEEQEYYALTRRAFDMLAPFYNLATLPLVRVRERVVQLAGAGPGASVLDVATGTGQQAFAFARAGCDVTAVDLTESMLAIARKNRLAGQVKFEAADATRLRFEANTFDVTSISFALHDMPPRIREQVLREMHRVTKPDGAIVIVDYDLPRCRVGSRLIHFLIGLYEGKYYEEFISSDLDSLLEGAGIRVIARTSILLGAGRILKAARSPQSRPAIVLSEFAEIQ